ncbi:MAG TPA: GTPase Era [Steroidobacteraceae bacterium]|nr:GTPase Era [Steroidobacteraceae bacterium]
MSDSTTEHPAQTGEPSLPHCGFAALVGRPNVGKSTILNALLGRKVSIVSPKPQTTRTRIHGVLTRPGLQIVFVDLPGLHTRQTRAINRYMNRTALNSLADADVNLFVVEALRFGEEDERALAELKAAGRPIVLLVNKVDRVHPKSRLLAFMGELAQKAEFADLVPVSATRGTNLDKLPALIARHLPASPLLYPADQVTDSPEGFMAAEIVREKLMLRLQEELPYGLTVGIEGMGESEDEPGKLVIQAVIWVERTGQKAIVIGKGGERLKEIGRQARLDLNRHFGRPVHLELWVKVKEDWSNDERAMRQLGFES